MRPLLIVALAVSHKPPHTRSITFAYLPMFISTEITALTFLATSRMASSGTAKPFKFHNSNFHALRTS